MASRGRTLLWTLCLPPTFLAGPTLGEAQQEAPAEATERAAHGLVIAPVQGDIRVDGRWEVGEWDGIPTQQLLLESAPRPNRPAAARTTCAFAYSTSHLFFTCRAWDDRPEEIRAFLTERDGGAGHDRVGFVIDPVGDARRGFHFSVTPVGVQRDALWDETAGRESVSWDAIWEAAGERTEDGYIVEAAVPWTSLRFSPSQPGQTWRLYFFRHHPRSERVWYRSFFFDTSNSCLLCQADITSAPTGISPGRNVELSPTVVAERSELPDQTSPRTLRSNGGDLDLGFTGRWGITSDLSLTGTINPDFSQVEADELQLTANERFALFVPERRPFFLEGADLFETPIRAVFSRTIVDPEGGAKLSGKLGANALGFMAIRDRASPFLMPGPGGSTSTFLDEPSTAVVGRVRRDFSPRFGAGLLYTGRSGAGFSNHVASADVSIRPLTPLSIQMQALESWTRGPEIPADSASSSAGSAARLLARWNTRTWNGHLDLYHVDARARLDLGFEPAAGFDVLDGWVRRNWWGREQDWYTRFDAMAGIRIYRTEEGLWDETLWFANLGAAGPYQMNLSVSPRLSRQAVAGRSLEFGQVWTNLSVQPTGRATLRGHVGLGRAIDYSVARLADFRDFGGEANLRIGQGLDITAALNRRALWRGGLRTLNASISRLRLVYNLSNRMRVRLVSQYASLMRQGPGDDLERSRNLASSFLFSYVVNPQTVLYLGYGDERANQAGLNDPDTFLPKERSLFIKMGYAFRP